MVWLMFKDGMGEAVNSLQAIFMAFSERDKYDLETKRKMHLYLFCLNCRRINCIRRRWVRWLFWWVDLILYKRAYLPTYCYQFKKNKPWRFSCSSIDTMRNELWKHKSLLRTDVIIDLCDTLSDWKASSFIVIYGGFVAALKQNKMFERTVANFYRF